MTAEIETDGISLQGTVSAGFARHLMQVAIARGADAAALAARAGVRADTLDDPDHRVPMIQYVALMRAAQALCGCPTLALELGATRDLRELSVIGLICYAARTMGEALAELNRYGQLAMEVDVPVKVRRFELTPKDGELWLVDTRRAPDAFPELTESTFSRFIVETARHFPGAAFAKRAHVTHAAPPHAAAYEALWKVPVTFAAAWNAIAIDPSWLDLELDQPSPYAAGVLGKHADQLLAELARGQTVRGRVEAALLRVLHTSAGMEPIAAALGQSRATLYRQLKDEGVTFELVVDELRHRMALHYLDTFSVNETAYLVGFSEPSAFSRAFKRWTGRRPGQRRSPRRGIVDR
jgi:AraC-like DNA-binding protein